MQIIFGSGRNIARKVVVWIFLLSSTIFINFNDVLANDRNVLDDLRKQVSISMQNCTLEQILSAISKQTGLNYGFQSNGMVDKNRRFTLSVNKVSVDEALAVLLKGSPYTYRLQNNSVIIVVRNEKPVEMVSVKGRVVDEKGYPIPGATVLIHGTTQGVATDANGNYAISMRPDDILRVSCVGYKTEIVPLKGKTKIDVSLNLASENIEEVTVVAFGEQKKESLVSSITTVRPMDLKTSSSDLTSSFAGKIAGVIGWQTGGLPGALTEEEMNTKFYVRGITSFQTSANVDPLILIDGVESSKLDLSRIAPEDIESFSVMKDASATAMYGARGANGVILVTTKKGEEGSVYATVRYESVFSKPTKEIEVADPIEYMKMYNQALLTRDPLATPKYSVERINRTASGKYPSWVYPANDWYKTMFKDYSVNHHFGLSIRGGSKVIQYYASINHNRDKGMLKTDRLNDFDCNIQNNQTSFRTNLNINLKAGIRLVLNTSATLDRYHGPLQNMSEAYYEAFHASPVDFAPTYPGDKTYSWPHLRFGSTPAGDHNPYMLLQKGYMERQRYSTINRAEYIQNLSSLIKGLEFRASVSYTQSGYSMTSYQTQPFMYSLSDYDFETGEHTLQALNKTSARRTLKLGKSGASTDSRVTYEGRLLHTAAWKDHQTSLTAVLQAQEQNYTPVSSVLDGMPRRNLTYSMRGSYGYKDRYFIEGSFGYNGSERFADKNKMGFFPAAGCAWVASSEPFLAGTKNWLSFLKFRASYGKVGNDGIIEEPRFVYLPKIDGDNYKTVDPMAFGSVLVRYKIMSYPNTNIQWEIAEQSNFGIEAKLFKGLFEFTLDMYQETRHNIISNRTTIPSSVGIEVAPLDNIGKARSRGIDFSGKIQHSFNNDYWFILNGTLTYNKSKYLELEEAIDKPVWQKRVGHEISQQIGYIAEGLFKDQAEIDNSPIQGGDVMPGDIRYRDLNKDGVIDVRDATYIGYPETPRLIYGFQGFFNLKDFEFSFAFQGSGKRSFFMNPMKISPFVNGNAMLSEIAKSHWSEDNMAARPFWPRLSTSNINQHNPQEDWYNIKNSEIRKSTYFMRECSFLRCTSLELAYNLPRNLMQKLRMQHLKFFVRANNPFVITNFKIWDVELGENGFNYPIQKTYTLGLNLSF